MATTARFGLIFSAVTWFVRLVDTRSTPKFSGRDIRRTLPCLLSQTEALHYYSLYFF